jgi:hypothetical protein
MKKWKEWKDSRYPDIFPVYVYIHSEVKLGKLVLP